MPNAAEKPKAGKGKDARKTKPEGAKASKVAKSGALRLKDLIDQVAEASGGKKADVKPVVEATLARLMALLVQGESLSLQGFGHMRVARKATADKPVATIRLRFGEGGKGKANSVKKDDKTTLAEDLDQG